MWHIIIDQIAQSGAEQRYGSEIQCLTLRDAVEGALYEHRMKDIEAGQYQITATSMEHDR